MTTTKAVLEARLAKIRRRLSKTAPERRDAHGARVALAASSIDDVVQSDRDADLAWRGVELGFALALHELDSLAKSSTSRSKSNANLKRKMKTDDEVRAVLERGGTRAEQAKELGFGSVRALQRRLRAMSNVVP